MGRTYTIRGAKKPDVAVVAVNRLTAVSQGKRDRESFATRASRMSKSKIRKQLLTKEKWRGEWGPKAA